MGGLYLKDIREECLEANLKLPKTGLVDLTFGNVSVLDKASGIFAIKPSGVPYGDLKASDMVLVDLDGRILESRLKPSSDTPTHRRLFIAFAGDGVRSVVHTHSRCAVSFAQAGKGIPCLGTTHADHFYGTVPVTRQMTPEEIQGEYEWETGNVIVECFQTTKPLDIPAVLVRGHGPFAWNVSGSKAVEYAEALEISADMALKTFSLVPDCPPIPQALLDKHFLRKHGAGAYYGQG